jgi:hypothetical protein
VVNAAHLSASVESPFTQRGGLMMVAPPGNFKSTLLKFTLENYPDAIVLSDINVQTLMPMRDEIAAGRYRTLGFPAFEKIYERQQATASNVEGIIKAMVDEGFSEASFQGHRMLGKFEARCCIIAAIIPSLYRDKFQKWHENGFSRRFLWCFYQLSDPNVLVSAIHEWKRIQFNEDETPVLPLSNLPFTVTPEESRQILVLLKNQHGKELPFIMMKKILSVLKWRFKKHPSRPMEIIRDFSESLGKTPVKLDIDLKRDRRVTRR